MADTDKEHGGSTDAKHELKARAPDFTPKWSKEWVLPYNLLKEADADVELVVDSVWPEDGRNLRAIVRAGELVKNEL